MAYDDAIDPENVRIDAVQSLSAPYSSVDVLRLDLIHPIISGNKWFKLKEYLKEAGALHKKTILSFGGAFSNHIVATAAATKQAGLQSIGIIRGERPPLLSHTLQQAEHFGMKLFFLSREDYKRKMVPPEVYLSFNKNEIYEINEGGYGRKGAEGAGDILRLFDTIAYTHIMAAVGTGTTLAGLVQASGDSQNILGISVLKNNFSLQQEIEHLLPKERHYRFSLLHEYHFGGYAKYSPQLLEFMNDWFRQTGIPSDFVYTGKLFFAVHDLLQKRYFPDKSKILVVHSGGLQGNLSLPKGTLIF
jgi:1-aminocyclopropane-1-carboxylate deaminase